ncbi:MAG TPA: hypothetical protein VF941_20975 [Clostridia bacterium]
MYIRSDEHQLMHDSLVRAAAKALEKKGYCVTADHVIGWEGDGEGKRPSYIGDYIPDIIASKKPDGRIIIVEAETEDTYNSSQTESQLRAFGRQGDDKFSGCNINVCVLVPGEVEGNMKEKLNEWGLTLINVNPDWESL